MDSHKTSYPAEAEMGQYQDDPGINFAVWIYKIYKNTLFMSFIVILP